MKLITIIKYLLIEQKNKLSINNLFSYFFLFLIYVFFIIKSENILIKLIDSFIDNFGHVSFFNFLALLLIVNWIQIYIFNFNTLFKEILDNNLAASILHLPIDITLIFQFKSFQFFIYVLNWINHLFVAIPLFIAISTIFNTNIYKLTITIILYFLLDYSINAISIIITMLLIKFISKSKIDFLNFCLNGLWSLLVVLFLIIFFDKNFIGKEIYSYSYYLFNSDLINLLPSKWLLNIIISNNIAFLIFYTIILMVFIAVVLFACTFIFKKYFDGFFYDRNYTNIRKSKYSEINNKFIALLNLEFNILLKFNASVLYTSIYIVTMFFVVILLKFENARLFSFFCIISYIIGMSSTLVISKAEKNQLMLYQMCPIKFIHIYLSKLFICFIYNFLFAFIIITTLFFLNYFTSFTYLQLFFYTGILITFINIFLLDIGLYFRKNTKYNSDFIAVMYLILFITSYLWSFHIFIILALITFLCQQELRIKIFNKYENGELI